MFQNGKAISTFLALALLLAAGQIHAAPVVIRFSHVVADNTPKGQMALKFKSLVNERMKDKFVVEVYPNSQMFDDSQIFEALLLDDVQMAAPSMSKFSVYTKKLQVFDLPFLFREMTAVERFQKSSDGQALLTSFTNRGLIGLGYLHNGLKQLSATRKLVEPDDAKGLKFRIISSDVLEAQFKAVGADTAKKPFSQVYTLLATGVLDGQENTWSNIYSKKFYTVQPYITESNHGLVDYMVVTSVNFWESLSENDRKELQKALDEAIAHGNVLANKKAKEDRQKIINSKEAEIIKLTNAQRLKWVNAMKPVWKQFEGEIGKELINSAFNSNQ